jgi:putative mRNA 3-end processing factor
MATRSRRPQPRTFVYRSGTRLTGTVVACDATGGGDLLFLSNALGTAGAGVRGARMRRSRGQILTTPETLALMGSAGDRLRPRALTLAYGRPFGLGTLRVELLPTGVLPGGAALACEDGGRRILYAGAARLGSPAYGAAPGEVRAATAVCIDATFGHPRFRFLSRADAEARARQFVRDTRAAGRAPVILATALGPAQDLACALAADGWQLRAHRSIVEAAAAYRRAGVNVPPMARFAGKLAGDEVLLWPATDKDAGLIRRLGEVSVAWVSGRVAEAAAVAALQVDVAIPYAHHADFAGLIDYVTATGAHEVAVKNGFPEDLAEALRARGLDAYVIGPPRQIDLFAADV